MRYRKLDANGDYSFGHQTNDFFKDQPEAVGQAVQTRLDLIEGEWFLDTTEGTPWKDKILGYGTEGLYEAALQSRILGTPGVTQLSDFASAINPITREMIAAAVIDTTYGQLTMTLPL